MATFKALFFVLSLNHQLYKYFSLYVDHDSRFLYSHFQEGKTAAEMLKGKSTFKAFTKASGVNI